MKTMNQMLRLLFMTVLITGFIACDDDDLENAEPEVATIADFVASNPDYTQLNEALIRTGLDATLDAEGTFTVFAPDNSAFNAFLGGTAVADVDVDVLTQVLLNHVIGTTIFADQLATGYVNNLATYADTDANLSTYINVGPIITINGGAAASGGADVILPDLIFTNGVVHAVNAVIDLPTVVTFATADPTFDTLEAALTADSSFTFVSTLSGNGPFTVFAPTNQAFQDLLANQGVSTLSELVTEIGLNGLETTLALHVISGANVRAADLTSGTVTTLGGTVTIDATNATITDANGRVSSIILTDVQAANGVIHAIDKVILPGT